MSIGFGIIGGRLYHVVSSPDAYFGPGFDGTGDLSLIPQIQRGGLGIWGAVVLGVVGAWIGCRRSGVERCETPRREIIQHRRTDERMGDVDDAAPAAHLHVDQAVPDGL